LTLDVWLWFVGDSIVANMWRNSYPMDVKMSSLRVGTRERADRAARLQRQARRDTPVGRGIPPYNRESSGLADFGPGVDEFDDFVGVLVVVAEVGDGVEEAAGEQARRMFNENSKWAGCPFHFGRRVWGLILDTALLSIAGLWKQM
jgi:hypothetical protein